MRFGQDSPGTGTTVVCRPLRAGKNRESAFPENRKTGDRKDSLHACVAAKWAAAAPGTMTAFRPAWRGNSLGAARFRRALERRLSDCPDDLERRLPPPPDCEHGLVGGDLIRRTAEPGWSGMSSPSK